MKTAPPPGGSAAAQRRAAEWHDQMSWNITEEEQGQVRKWVCDVMTRYLDYEGELGEPLVFQDGTLRAYLRGMSGLFMEMTSHPPITDDIEPPKWTAVDELGEEDLVSDDDETRSEYSDSLPPLYEQIETDPLMTSSKIGSLRSPPGTVPNEEPSRKGVPESSSCSELSLSTPLESSSGIVLNVSPNRMKGLKPSSFRKHSEHAPETVTLQ
ncbi:hypothetical protein M231_07221 [Tremella mesenterica]|uniref:Uncharacterized protein n=1 Tax=Tremella mesenterica TaxID=5217 RepID=A0A4Q1B9W3_TREME|nr:hypothetical protein M231_07221 [Tremella mesenterica]